MQRFHAAAAHATPNGLLNGVQRLGNGNMQRRGSPFDDDAGQPTQDNLHSAFLIDSASRTVGVPCADGHPLDRPDLAPIRRSRNDFLHVAEPKNPLAADATTVTTCYCKFRCLGSAHISPQKPINDHLRPYNLKRSFQTEGPTGPETTVFAGEFAGSQFALQEGKRVS